MKVKTKLIASIMSICLVCAVFAIGVFALKTANLKIGGDVSFSATGVEADIKNVTLTGATTNDQVLATGKINTSMTQAEIDSTFQNWQTLKLDFDADATDIELKFDIANTSTNADNYIEINYDYSFTTANPNVDVFPGDENAEDVWENNNYILAPKGATPAAGDYETFTLKFRVVDKELNVPQDTKVSVIISLKHVTPKSAAADANNVVTIDNIQYTLNPSKQTASVSGHTLSGTNVSAVIHPIVKDSAESAVPCVVTGFDDGVFYEYHNLTSISIPSSVTSLATYLFQNCNISSLTLPNSITTLGYGAFCGISVSSFVIPNGVSELNDCLFERCDDLSSVTIPSGVTYIGDSAFLNCAKLTSITIPKKVTSIGGGAFQDTGISSIFIPKSVTNIGEVTLRGCKNLTSIVVEDGNSVYDSRNNCNAIIETASNKMRAACKTTIIPNSVTRLAWEAFDECTGLTSIVIPSSVECIEHNSFSSCENLTSAKFENPTGWFKAASADATSGTSVTVTSDFTEANANVLKGIGENEYMLRKDA